MPLPSIFPLAQRRRIPSSFQGFVFHPQRTEKRPSRLSSSLPLKAALSNPGTLHSLRSLHPTSTPFQTPDQEVFLRCLGEASTSWSRLQRSRDLSSGFLGPLGAREYSYKKISETGGSRILWQSSSMSAHSLGESPTHVAARISDLWKKRASFQLFFGVASMTCQSCSGSFDLPQDATLLTLLTHLMFPSDSRFAAKRACNGPASRDREARMQLKMPC